MLVIHALKWSFLAELAAKSFQPITLLVLTHFLTPEDFGVMTSALMVISFSQIFWEAGMGKALIQRQKDLDDAANAAFWINVCLGVIISILVNLNASSVANLLFNDKRVSIVLQVMSIQILLGSLSSVHTALLQKNFGFKNIFWLRCFSIIIPGMLSIFLVFFGLGFWSLVIGSITGQIVQCCYLWNSTNWRPKFRYNNVIAKEMIKFGAWVGITGLMAWGYSWIDGFIVSMYFGVEKLGLFRTGNQFAVGIFSLCFSFTTPVLYANFSLKNNNLSILKSQVFQISRIIAIISLPLASIIVLYRVEIEKILFGDKWIGISYIIAMISIKESILWIFAHYIEAYRALGKPKLETIIAFGSLAFSPFILIYFAKNGFNSFIFARAIILGLIGIIIHTAVAMYKFGKCTNIFLRLLIYIALFISICAIGDNLNQDNINTTPAQIKYTLPLLLFLILHTLEFKNSIIIYRQFKLGKTE